MPEITLLAQVRISTRETLDHLKAKLNGSEQIKTTK